MKISLLDRYQHPGVADLTTKCGSGWMDEWVFKAWWMYELSECILAV